MKFFCLNNISKTALDTLKPADTVVDTVEGADGILVRSYQMADYFLPKSVSAVARAGAGVNNIPITEYAKQGVVVFNTPGANANAVKELVICGMLLASRDIIGGNEWVRENKDDANIAKSAEKAKARFAGNEIKGKTLLVIGLGVIGVLVANAAVELGMNVIGYDPYLSVKNAVQLSKRVNYVERLAEAISQADFITLHAPLTEGTKNMISKPQFDLMKDGVILLNFARDALVSDPDLKEAIDNGRVKKYVTDFANESVVKLKNTVCLPHLGASTDEAEDNCAKMAIEELYDYLENGNIKNSVNYPSLDAGIKSSNYRICINHLNIPGLIASVSASISASGGNILTMLSQSRGEFAYTVLDLETEVNLDEITAQDGVLRVRVI